ncbi:MAG: GntR family transcriptional regulator [Inquilinaceae bacterium]
MTSLDALIATVEPHRTDAAFVHRVLRQAIIDGVLEAGRKLRQEHLAARLGTSRMPVREALRQLEAEGLVTFEAHKGAAVAVLSAADLREIYEMRVGAETMALKHAMRRMTPDALAEADAAQDAGRQAPLADFGLWNRRFHMALYAPAARPRLLAHIAGLNDAADRYLRLAVSQLDYAERSHAEHRAILEACRRGDADRAMALLAAHIETAGRTLTDFLKRRRTDGRDVGAGK